MIPEQRPVFFFGKFKQQYCRFTSFKIILRFRGLTGVISTMCTVLFFFAVLTVFFYRETFKSANSGSQFGLSKKSIFFSLFPYGFLNNGGKPVRK